MASLIRVYRPIVTTRRVDYGYEIKLERMGGEDLHFTLSRVGALWDLRQYRQQNAITLPRKKDALALLESVYSKTYDLREYMGGR